MAGLLLALTGNTGDISVNITSNSIISSVNSVVISAFSNYSSSGNLITATTGSVSVIGNSDYLIAGNNISLLQNNVLVTTDVIVNTNGSQFTTFTGNEQVSIDFNQYINGQFVSSNVGSVIGSGDSNYSIAGNLINSAVGSVIVTTGNVVDITVNANGSQLDIYTSNVSVEISKKTNYFNDGMFIFDTSKVIKDTKQDVKPEIIESVDCIVNVSSASTSASVNTHQVIEQHKLSSTKMAQILPFIRNCNVNVYGNELKFDISINTGSKIDIIDYELEEFLLLIANM